MLCSQKKDATRIPRVTGRDQMQTRRRIKHEVPGRELDFVGAVEVLDHQFAAVILVRLRQKQRHRQVGPDPQAGEAISPHRVVDMEAEMVPAGGRVAVE